MHYRQNHDRFGSPPSLLSLLGGSDDERDRLESFAPLRTATDRFWWRVACLFGLLCMAGCGSQGPINDVYGKRQGTSVNGTGVLARLFQDSGHSVSSWRRLSPKLEKEHVIVWAPDNFACPSTEQIDYLNTWLNNESGRTLIYIGRGYDASIDYWKETLDNASAGEAIEVRRLLAKARSELTSANGRNDASNTCPWFTLEHRTFDRLSGPVSGSWADGLTKKEFSASLAAQLIMPKPVETDDGESNLEFQSEPLLKIANEPFAVRLTREAWDGSQVIVVANGSTFLNLPLVRHENRILASRLIAECQPQSRVTFLESDARGPLISNSDKSAPIMLRAFTIWPINFLLIHFTVLGIFFCFAVFPIFGRPRGLNRESVSDFGKHVAAVGDLLRTTGNETYARNLLDQFKG